MITTKSARNCFYGLLLTSSLVACTSTAPEDDPFQATDPSILVGTGETGVGIGASSGSGSLIDTCDEFESQSQIASIRVQGFWKSICEIRKRLKTKNYDGLSPDSKKVAMCTDKLLDSGILYYLTTEQVRELIPSLNNVSVGVNGVTMVALLMCQTMSDAVTQGLYSQLDKLCIGIQSNCFRIPNIDLATKCYTSIDASCKLFQLGRLLQN